jgi:hypothetical protein
LLRLDNHQVFPEFCAKSPKWFRGGQNCFVAGTATTYFPPR